MVWTAVKELHRYINEFMRQTSLAYTVPAISHDLCMDESSRFNFFFGTVLSKPLWEQKHWIISSNYVCTSGQFIIFSVERAFRDLNVRQKQRSPKSSYYYFMWYKYVVRDLKEKRSWPEPTVLFASVLRLSIYVSEIVLYCTVYCIS